MLTRHEITTTMKRSGSKSAFDEAYEFAKDPRPFDEKSAEYDRKHAEDCPVDRSVNMPGVGCIG
jgi:hypothetical protein